MKSKSLLVLVAAIVTSASGCGGGYASSPPTNPVPSINSLNPGAAVAGGPGLTLNVGGANFVAGSVVRWNSSDRPTTVIPDLYSCSPSPNQCTGYVVTAESATAQIPASDIVETGTAEITVFSPAPGGGTSNTVTFTIAAHGVYPSSVAVDHAGTFAYVTNSGSDNVSTYAINTDGTLAFKATIAAGRNPASVALDPSGKFAYVANYGENLGSLGSVPGSVSMYRINADGLLTSIGTINEVSRYGTWSVTVHPSGKFAYVPNISPSTISTYSIDATTGALMSTGTIATGVEPISVAVDPSGKFAYVASPDSNCCEIGSSISMYTIDTTTGALTPNGEIDPIHPILGTGTLRSSSVVVDPSGRFVYVGNTQGVSMFSIDATTGKLTSMGSVDAGGAVYSVAVHPSGNFAYATATANSFLSPGYVSVYTLNAATGVLASNGTAPTEQYPSSIAINPSGKFAYVANYDSHSISMYTIDAVTGTLTLIGTVGT